MQRFECYLISTQFVFFQNDIFVFSIQEMVYFHENLSTITESLLGINWRDTKLELPFEGFTKQAHPEVIFITVC